MKAALAPNSTPRSRRLSSKPTQQAKSRECRPRNEATALQRSQRRTGGLYGKMKISVSQCPNGNLQPGLDCRSCQAKSPPALFAWRTAQRMAADIASAPYVPTRLTSAFSSPMARAKRVLPNLNLMLQEYCQLQGWTPEGVPKDDKPAELGLK